MGITVFHVNRDYFFNTKQRLRSVRSPLTEEEEQAYLAVAGIFVPLITHSYQVGHESVLLHVLQGIDPQNTFSIKPLRAVAWIKTDDPQEALILAKNLPEEPCWVFREHIVPSSDVTEEMRWWGKIRSTSIGDVLVKDTGEIYGFDGEKLVLLNDR